MTTMKINLIQQLVIRDVNAGGNVSTKGPEDGIGVTIITEEKDERVEYTLPTAHPEQLDRSNTPLLPDVCVCVCNMFWLLTFSK